MFRIGEKVVYVGKIAKAVVNQPKQNEIVTIQDFDTCPSGVVHAVIKGYLTAKDGLPQVFKLIHFRKLDHTFAEEVTARIEEEINQENLVGA
jgi:hypothetical protein